MNRQQRRILKSKKKGRTQNSTGNFPIYLGRS